MGIKDWLFGPKKVLPSSYKGLPIPTLYPPMPAVKPPKVRTPRKPKVVEKEVVAPTEKEIATAKGEPWVSVISMDVDIDNMSEGSFDLDWNEIFVARLLKFGYRGKDDVQIVDQWFQSICRNIVLETYEQDQADPTNRKT